MRVLLDHSVPALLAKALFNHQVRTAAQEGWDALKNGDLLAAIAASQKIDVFATCDQSIAYQQNLKSRRVAIVVINTNIWPVIMTDTAKVVRAVETATNGSFQVVDDPKRPLSRRPFQRLP